MKSFNLISKSDQETLGILSPAECFKLNPGKSIACDWMIDKTNVVILHFHMMNPKKLSRVSVFIKRSAKVVASIDEPNMQQLVSQLTEIKSSVPWNKLC